MTHFPIKFDYERTDGNGAYIPSPTEIKEECAKIRKTWGSRELASRIVITNPEARIFESITKHHRKLTTIRADSR